MTEEQVRLVLDELARIVHFNRETQWFHGAERERHIALEIADFVLSGMRGTDDAKASPPDMSAAQLAYRDGYDAAVETMHRVFIDRFPRRTK